jgi:hypothetical protein
MFLGVRKACGSKEETKIAEPKHLSPCPSFPAPSPFRIQICLLCALACLCELAIRKQGIHSHSPSSSDQSSSIPLRARGATGDWSVVSSGGLARCMHGLVHAHRHQTTTSVSVSALLAGVTLLLHCCSGVDAAC